VELILTFVGGVNAVVGGHFGSWMIFVSLCLSFCAVKKGLPSLSGAFSDCRAATPLRSGVSQLAVFHDRLLLV
jgi:hypothetical protein